jgi:hypothetical protein
MLNGIDAISKIIKLRPLKPLYEVCLVKEMNMSARKEYRWYP